MIAASEQLQTAVLEKAGDAVTAIVAYDGDSHRGVYLRDDVKSRFSEAENDEIRKEFFLAALSDPATNPDSAYFGPLEFTIRCFRNEFIAHLPVGEWTGVLVGFERREITNSAQLFDWLEAIHRDLQDGETVA
ncbi:MULTISPECIES: hypothetical protein [unclassified Haladaptatus]|uniref:hypothetical protein n=1 Tax=unclassified Haladaptatus TaxID=2622732 RepID=UPI0023E81562|nr:MULTISPECIES: hypothetical protein [unclassified Haladaptatus]